MGLLDNALTGIAGSALGAIGNVVGGLMQGHAQRSANRANMELAKYQQEDEILFQSLVHHNLSTYYNHNQIS